MEGFRSSYRQLPLDATASPPPNPYATALQAYQDARETGLRLLFIAGGLLGLLLAVALFWAGRLSVESTRSSTGNIIAASFLPVTSAEKLHPTSIAISENNAHLHAQLNDANRDRSLLQTLLDRTRKQAEEENGSLRATVGETHDFALSWVDHAQANLLTHRDRLKQMRDHQLTRSDPFLDQILDNASAETEFSIRQYIELQTLETQSAELDAIEELQRACQSQVSVHLLERASLPDLLKNLREIETRIARVGVCLDAVEERMELFAHALNEAR